MDNAQDEAIIGFAALIVQNLRSLPWFGQGWTLGVLAVAAALATVLNHYPAEPAIVAQSFISIARYALGNQYLLHMAAQGTQGKIPGLPQFNQNTEVK